MLDVFYSAFVEELKKVAAGKPLVPFDKWREHFKRTGRKSMMKRPSASEAILGKKATITKRVSPTPSGGYSLDWFGDPRTKTKMKV